MSLRMGSPVTNSYGVYQARLVVRAEFQAELEMARRKLESEFKFTDAVIESLVFEWRQETAKKLGANPNAINPYLIQHGGLIEENNIPLIM